MSGCGGCPKSGGCGGCDDDPGVSISAMKSSHPDGDVQIRISASREVFGEAAKVKSKRVGFGIDMTADQFAELVVGASDVMSEEARRKMITRMQDIGLVRSAIDGGVQA